MSLRAIPVWLRLLLVVEIVAVCAYVMLASDQLDLSIYRMGGTAVLDGSDDLYQVTDPSGLVFTYPPFAAVLFTVFVGLGDASRLVLPILSVIALGRAGWLVARQVDPGSMLGRWDRSTVAAGFLAVSLLSEPYVATLDYGQINLILLWAVVQGMLGAERAVNGALVGLAAAVKLVPAAFVLLLVLQRRLRLAAYAVGAFVVSVAVGFVVLPDSSKQFWTGVMVDARRVGGVAYAGNQSVNGALWRLVGPGGQVVVWGAAVVVIAVVTLQIVRRTDSRLEALVAVALAALLVSPISWSHHWVWISVVVVALLGVRSTSTAGVALAAVWIGAQLSRVVWWWPHADELEYADSLAGKLATDAYVLLALVTLAFLVWKTSARSVAAGAARGDSR